MGDCASHGSPSSIRYFRSRFGRGPVHSRDPSTRFFLTKHLPGRFGNRITHADHSAVAYSTAGQSCRSRPGKRGESRQMPMSPHAWVAKTTPLRETSSFHPFPKSSLRKGRAGAFPAAAASTAGMIFLESARLAHGPWAPGARSSACGK